VKQNVVLLFISKNEALQAHDKIQHS